MHTHPHNFSPTHSLSVGATHAALSLTLSLSWTKSTQGGGSSSTAHLILFHRKPTAASSLAPVWCHGLCSFLDRASQRPGLGLSADAAAVRAPSSSGSGLWPSRAVRVAFAARMFPRTGPANLDTKLTPRPAARCRRLPELRPQRRVRLHRARPRVLTPPATPTPSTNGERRPAPDALVLPV